MNFTITLPSEFINGVLFALKIIFCVCSVRCLSLHNVHRCLLFASNLRTKTYPVGDSCNYSDTGVGFRRGIFCHGLPWGVDGQIAYRLCTHLYRRYHLRNEAELFKKEKTSTGRAGCWRAGTKIIWITKINLTI